MRKLTFFSMLIASVSVFAQSGMIDLGGTQYPVDTTMHYQVGPGVQHTRFTIDKNGTRHHCYLLEVDLTNNYNTIEEYQSASQIGKTETMASAYVAQDAENHRTIGGVNCNFWIVPANINADSSLEGCLGQPFAGTARNGVMIGNPSNWNRGEGERRDRGYVMVNSNKQVKVDDVNFQGLVTVNNQTYDVRDVNRCRVNTASDELCVFNHYLGTQPTRNYDGIEIVFEVSKWAINAPMQCKVKSTNTTGGTVLQEGEGALQGNGNAKTFLEQLKVGDSFQLDLNAISSYTPEEKFDIQHMATGNALILKDGIKTPRNYNEDYNNKNYPRTVLATNREGNRFYMLVAEKPGMFSADMCDILLHCGATDAAGMDGGGSAQMCLDGVVINPTTEGVPRAVANSWWVFSTAPDDTQVAKITSYTPTLRLPKYGVCQPEFLSYNQYDVLLETDVEGVTLSCDEATGYIDDKGRFVCMGNGTLTATYGNITCTIPVRLEENALAHIRLDTIIVSDDTRYPIEVESVVGKNTVLIQPSALRWEVTDESICSVSSEGVLSGVGNGGTWVYGTLGENKPDSLYVIVEIPATKPLLWNDMRNASAWKVEPSEEDWNTALRTNADGKAELYMHYTGGRQANIMLTLNDSLYSVPERVEFRCGKSDFPVKELSLTLQANKSREPKTHNVVLSPDWTSVSVRIDSLLGAEGDMSVYPVLFQDIILYLQTSSEYMNKDYVLPIDGIYLHYPKLSVGIESVPVGSLFVYPNPTADILHISGISGCATAVLYDLQGRQVLAGELTEVDSSLDISRLTEGTYLLHIGTETIKIIRK